MGFTLIELLVAITILSIVSSIGLTTYSNAQIVTRDSKRKSDIRSIQVALDLYYAEHKRYPAPNSATNGHGPTEGLCPSWSSPGVENDCWNGLLSGYINHIPVDPQNTQSPLRMYAYKTQDLSTDYPGCPPEGQWYELLTLLENTNDPDRIETKDVLWCDGSSLQPSMTGSTRKQLFFVIKK